MELLSALSSLGAIGYEVEIIGTHGQEQHLAGPDRAEYYELYRDLRALAAVVVPRGLRMVWVELLPFDHSVHAS